MTLKKNEIARIRKLKADGDPDREIKDKTGYSLGVIVKYTKNMPSLSSASATASRPEKKNEIPQERTDQTLDKILNKIQQVQHQNPDNQTDVRLTSLEQKVNNLVLANQIQEPARDPHLEKQNEERKPTDLKPQQIQFQTVPSSVFQRMPETSLDQTDVTPQETEEGDNDILLDFFMGCLAAAPIVKKLFEARKKLKQTGVWTWPSNKTNERKIKHHELKTIIPILPLAPIRSIIPVQSTPQTKKESKKEPHNNPYSESTSPE